MKSKSFLLLTIILFSTLFTLLLDPVYAKSSNTIPQFIQDQIALEALGGIHHEIKKIRPYQTEHFINYVAFNRKPLIKLIKTNGGCDATILNIYYDSLSERIRNILNNSCSGSPSERLDPEVTVSFHHCTLGDLKCICGHHPEREGCSMSGGMSGMSGMSSAGSSSSGGMSAPVSNFQCIPDDVSIVIKKNTDKYLDRLYNAINSDQNSNNTPDVCENNDI